MAAEPRTVAAGTILRGSRTTLTALQLDKVRANPEQPRKHFDAGALAELAASLAQHGVLQPVIVKRDGDGYLIMAGERRFRAAQLAGLTIIPEPAAHIGLWIMGFWVAGRSRRCM